MKRVHPSSAGSGNTRPAWREFDLSGVRMVPQQDPQGEAQRLPARRHMFGLAPAPTFYPSAAEFQDPLAYIQKIRPLAESAGLCKIVPPEGWSPPFSLDTKRFRFKTRIQKLNSLEGKTRTNLNYLDQLHRFHSQQGRPMVKVPQLDHRPIDLYGLRHEVTVRGGYQKVNGEKRWAEIGRVMKYDRKTCTSMSNSLKSTYQKYILPFELYLAKHGGAPPGSQSTGAGGGDDDNGSSSAPPAEGTRRSKRRHSSRDDPPDSSDAPVGPSPTRVAHPGVALPRASSPAASADSTTTSIPETCEVCRSAENEDSMLICDGCDRGFHMFCLNPPLRAIPSNDWYCDSCVLNRSSDYGFEDGAEYTLEAFKRKADDFKRRFFAEYYRTEPGQADPAGGRGGRALPEYLVGPQMEGRVPEEVVEEEFWNLVASPYKNVEVEYGADLHSAQLGSGFPTTERDPLEPYARHPWNLNMLPFQRESLFNYIHQDISGMKTPWIYVGMCFSTFCWHNEDHYTYSVNYQHWGDTKTWYAVPGRHAEKFENAMRQTVPELFEDEPDLLFQLVTMLSPEVLVGRGVDVVTCDQRAGEFIVTFPQGYHAGFNQGFNFNEAVNFATPDWLPYGAASVDRYRHYARNPVFSHDELLMTMYGAGPMYRDQPWFQAAIVDMLRGERTDRARIRALWHAAPDRLREAPWDHVVTPDADIPEDARQQCLVCKAFSYLSAVVCDCSPNYVTCLRHAEKGCKCTGSKKVLIIRLTDAGLGDMLAAYRQPKAPDTEPAPDAPAPDTPPTLDAPGGDVIEVAKPASTADPAYSVAPADETCSGSTKAQIWKDEFRRVMSLYSTSRAPSTVVGDGGSVKYAPSARDDDDDSLGDAHTVASNGAPGREGAGDSPAEGPADQLDGDSASVQQSLPAVKGTMTLADLNRRPDLTQMVLLLEEAQRLVLREGLAATEAAKPKPKPTPKPTPDPLATRGKGGGHIPGRKRGRPRKVVVVPREEPEVQMDDPSVNERDAPAGAAPLAMIGKEIEQLIAIYSGGADGHRPRNDLAAGNTDVLAPMSSRSVADLQIIGDVRQLNRFVRRAQEWCRAAQAFLMCLGHTTAIDQILAKQQANYAWHRQKLLRRLDDLLDEPDTPLLLSLSIAESSPVSARSHGNDRSTRAAKRSRADSSVATFSSYDSDETETNSSSSSSSHEDDHEDDVNDDGNYGTRPSEWQLKRRRKPGPTDAKPRRGRKRGSIRWSGRPEPGEVTPEALRLMRTRGVSPVSPVQPLLPRTRRAKSQTAGSPATASLRRQTRRVAAQHEDWPFAQSLVDRFTPARLVDEVWRVLNDGDVPVVPPSVGRPRKAMVCPFTTEDLSKLLQIGEQLYFSSPEFEALLEWEIRALRAEQAARAIVAEGPSHIRQLARLPPGQEGGSEPMPDDAAAALETPAQAAFGRKVASMVNELRLVRLRVPVAAEVQRVEQGLEWCHTARTQLKMGIMTHASLVDLVRTAGELELDGQMELCAWLSALQQDVDAWSEAANEIIDSSQMLDLRDVGGLLEKGRNMALVPVHYQELRELQQTALDLQAQSDTVVERAERTAFVQRPRYDEARALVAECEDFGRFEPSTMGQVRAELAKADAWLAGVLGVFAYAAPHDAAMAPEQLDAILDPIQKRLRRALELAVNGATPQDAADAFCACLATEGGRVLRCLHCSDRYHAQCLSLEPADCKGRPFLCPLCNAAAQGTRLCAVDVYPALARVGRAVDECRTLGLIAQTLDPLVTILLDGQNLASVARRAVKDKAAAGTPPADEAGRRVPLLRLLARVLLGLGVDLKQGLLGDLWEEAQRLAPGGPDPQAARTAVVARMLGRATEQRQERAQIPPPDVVVETRTPADADQEPTGHFWVEP